MMPAEFEATYPEAMNRSDRAEINTADMMVYYDEKKMTRTGERFDSLAGRIDRLLANTDRRLRVIETMALIAAAKHKVICMVLVMEGTLTMMMSHPVIFPSPVGIELSNAITVGIKKIRSGLR